MHNAIPLSLAVLMAVGIIVIGCFYLVSPERISGTLGLKPPASDGDTRAWLRPKGIRDVVNFFDGITKPWPTQVSDFRTSCSWYVNLQVAHLSWK
jgi:hypothetical protein